MDDKPTDFDEMATEPAGPSAIVSAYKQGRRALARIAGRFVRPQDIEDIVQETFLRTYEASLRTHIIHPKSFMEKAARNIALNFTARKDNEEKEDIEGIADTEPFEGPSAEDWVDSQEKFVIFCKAIRRLPVQCQRAFLLKKVYGLHREEIARRLNITEGTVQKHVAKALDVVADYMESMEAAAAWRKSRNSGPKGMRSE